jgi:hypothetical protein
MCVLLLRKARPPREQYVLMAEVSERAKISEELEEIAAFYREGRQAHG